MTDTERIQRLATEVMGWHEGKARHCGVCRWWWDEAEENYMGAKYARCDDYDEVWNPLTDWNHWRQVEEKVMEDETLFFEFSVVLADSFGTPLIRADLPTRVDALLAALDSLKADYK